MPRFLPLLIAVILIGITSQLASAHSSCTRKLADLPQAPELIGFRLGMTKDQVKTRVPQVSFGGNDDLGVSKVTINPDFDSKFDKSTFPGVRSVSMDFLDAKLTSLWFGYDASFKWKTVDEFVKGVSHSLQLPAAWQSWRVRGQQLRCADFSMTVSIVAEGPSFRIVDETAVEELTARREAKEAAASGETTEDEGAASSEATETVIADKQSKTYFTSDCLPPKPIAANDRVTFQTTQAAEQAGFKKSRNCQ